MRRKKDMTTTTMMMMMMENLNLSLSRVDMHDTRLEHTSREGRELVWKR